MTKPIVLLVDDDRSSRSAIKVQLELSGIEVLFVTTNEQAVQKATSLTVNLILCSDTFVNNEFCLVTNFRNNPKLYRVPFIIITNPFAGNILDALASLGINDIIIKPFTGKILVDKVKKQLEIARKQHEFYRNEITDQIFSLLNKNFNQELLTPLNGIINAVSFSQTLPVVKDDDSLSELLQLIDNSCFRIQRNALNIRTYSYLKTDFTLSDIKITHHCKLEDKLSYIIKKYQHSGSQTNRMEFSVIDTGEWSGPEEWIQLLFTELIDNAIKFNAGSEAPVIKLHALGPTLLFSVTNYLRSSPSFTLADAGPFRKFHTDISRTGLGLGLYNCVRICELLGYNLSLDVRQQSITFTLEA